MTVDGGDPQLFRHEAHLQDQAVLIIPGGQRPTVDVVRHWAANAMAWVPMAPRLRVSLVVEELVSNARRHGRLPAVLRLSLDHTRRYVLVFVDDAGPATIRWPLGAGLTMVDGLALAWGVEPRAGGKTVWAEVPVGMRVEGLEVPPQPGPER
jgi:hypothetical protein